VDAAVFDSRERELHSFQCWAMDIRVQSLRV
jgi:hypothetical protein